MAGIELSSLSNKAKGALGSTLAPRLAEGVLVIVLGALLAMGFIKLVSPLSGPRGDAMAALSAAPSAVQNEMTEARSPFPKAAVAPVAVDDAPDVAETSLDLTLTGVWPSVESASAIIRKPSGEQKTFIVGDEIVPGVRLVAVYTDQVLIEQNGIRESLRFESKAVVPQQAIQQSVAQQTSNTSGTAAEPLSFENLHTVMRVGPAMDEQGQPAIGVFAGSDTARFQRTGLEHGDVIRLVNGAPTPQDPAELARVMNDVANSGEATLVIERDGVRQTVSINLKELGNE